MERRREPRFELNAPVEVRLLAGEQVPRHGRIANIAGRGLKLLVESPLRPGALIRVDAGQVLLLGEVCYCLPHGSQWAAGVEMEHALTNLDQLVRLNQRLFGEEAGSPDGVKISRGS